MGRPARVFTKDEIIEIINLYSNNTSIKDIIEIFKTRRNSIKNILLNNNIPKKRNYELYKNNGLVINQKYTIDRDYFKIIDTEDKAYWLGFIYADGNVFVRKNKTGCLTISLKYDDVKHLENFLLHIKSNQNIKMINQGNFKYCNIAIGNTKMCEDLINLGCVPNKSLILKPPKINNKFILHFIRGYFDGDGCFAFYDKGNTKPFECNFIGTYDVMEFIKYSLEENNIKVSDIKKAENIYKIRITNRNNLLSFYNYLYKDKGDCFLERNFNKMNTYLKDINLLI